MQTAIGPIISAIVLIVKNVSGIDLGTDVENALVDIALGIYTVWGVWKNHHKTV